MTENMNALMPIGSVLGDADSQTRAWGRATGALSIRVRLASEVIQTPLRVYIVFHVDGRIAHPEFEGVRTGSFFTANSTLVVQAAIAGGVVEDYNVVLIPMLSEAIDEPERWAVGKKITVGLPALRALVEKPQSGEAQSDLPSLTSLRGAGPTGSIGNVASAYDDALMESFLGSLQIERVDRRA